MQHLKTVISTFFVFFILLFFSGSNAGASDQIVISTPSELKNVDPIKAWSIFEGLIVGTYCSTLTKIGEDGALNSHLLKGWDISADKKNYTFELREGVRFHDNTLLTVDDVIYSVSRHLWSENKSGLSQHLNQAFSSSPGLAFGLPSPVFEKLDNFRFVIKLGAPYTPLLSLLSAKSLCIIKKNQPEVGTGPMSIRRLPDGKGWELVRFENYFLKAEPIIGNIKLVPLPKTEEANSGRKKVDLDLVVGKIENPRVYGLEVEGHLDFSTVDHFFINPETSLGKDKNFRRQLAKILQSIAWDPRYINDLSVPTSSFLHVEVFSPRKVNLEYDLSREVKKLKKIMGGSTKPIRFVFFKGSFSAAFYARVTELLKRYRVPFSLKLVDVSDYFSATENRDLDVSNIPTTMLFPDPDGIDISFSSHRYAYEDQFSMFVGKIRYLTDKSERIKGYRSAFKKLLEQWVVVPACEIRIPYWSRKKLKLPPTRFKSRFEIWKIKKEF